MEKPPLSAALHAKSLGPSGRGQAFNNRTLEIAQLHDTWKTAVFSNLYFALISEYKELCSAFEDPTIKLSLLAWRSRNLLEISIWILYCLLDENNARTFYEDAGRDTLEMIRKMHAWGKANNQADEWLERFPKGESQLIKNAKAKKIESLEGSYKKVQEAASIVNMRQEFDICWKLLSKHAHPTAYSIIGFPEPEQIDYLKDFFYECGCTYFLHAFERAEENDIQLLEQLKRAAK